MKVTESKTITGKIVKVGQSKPRSTLWGEFLFKGREVRVKVNGVSQQTIITMYVRDNSWISEMKIPPDALVNKPIIMSVHGEAYHKSFGCIFIDKLQLLCKSVTCVNLNKYFDF